MNTSIRMGDRSNDLPADEAQRLIIRGTPDYAMPVSLDPHIRLKDTILVRAGAGSGKTSVLVDRMLALVRIGVPLEHIVAITFTRKAAGELQERFFGRLLEAMESVDVECENASPEMESHWEEERRNLEQALQEAEHVYIGTIHAFCAQLLRQRSLDLGIPPEFEQIDDRDEEALRQQFWSRYLHEASTLNNPDLAILQDADVPFQSLFGLFGTMAKNASVEFSPSNSPKPDPISVFETLREYVSVLHARIPRGDQDGFATEIERMNTMFATYDTEDIYVRMKLLGTALDMLSGTDRSKFEIGVMSWGPNKTESRLLANALKKGEDDLGLGKSFMAFLQEDVQSAVKEWQNWLHDAALRFASVSVEGYREFRLSSGKLTYDDLLSETWTLLRDHPGARSTFQARYRHILIDEFQDTDPVQAAMLFSLAAEEIDPVDWSKSKLIPGQLFVVGDDKQSIYRFRKADFQAFDLVGKAIDAQGGQVLNLSVNFRSDQRICDWVNGALSELFKVYDAPYQAPWEKLLPHKGHLGLENPVVHLEVLNEKGVVQLDRTKAEGAAIVTHIRRLMASEAGRDLTYGSFMILVRRHTNIPNYVESLTAAGIPVGVTGGKAERISEVLAWLDDLLRTLYDPKDGVALAATLRGLFFGVSDQDLFDFAQSGGKLKGLLDMEDTSAMPARLASATTLLKRLRSLFLEHPPHRAMELMLAESGIEALLRQGWDADTTSGMLQAVLELFRTWEAKGYTFGHCVEDLRLYRRGLLKLDSFSESVPFGSCVQIMTTHQAKGLQAEVVFLADSGGKPPPPATVHTYREGPRVLGKTPLLRQNGPFNVAVEVEPAGWDEALEIEHHFDLAEQTRLIYVACTRAMRQLVVSTNEELKNGPWDVLIPFLRPSDVHDLTATASGGTPRLPETAPADRPAAPAWSSERVKERIEALSTPSWQYDRPSEKDPALFAEGASAGYTEGEGLGMEYGSAVHALFESLIARRKEKPSRETVAEWTREAMQDRFDGAEAASLIESSLTAAMTFFDSPIWSELVEALRVLTEVPFTVTERRDGVDFVVSGVVDLAFRSTKGWVIVDYKTDKASEEVLLERHSAQISAYIRAWEQIFPEEACTGSIWSTHLGRSIQIR